MNPTEIRRLNDIIYMALFGKTALQLLIFFRIPVTAIIDTEDTLLRDHMGELALIALGDIEGACADSIKSNIGGFAYDEATTNADYWKHLMDIAQFHAHEIAIAYQAEAAGIGIDLLTGNVLVAQ